MSSSYLAAKSESTYTMSSAPATTYARGAMAATVVCLRRLELETFLILGMYV